MPARAHQVIASLPQLKREVFIVTTTSASNQNWPVPANFNPLDNTIEVYSHGGPGGNLNIHDDGEGNLDARAGGGGGSGGYAKAVNIPLTPGGIMVFYLATVGNGSDSSVADRANGTTLANASVGICGGSGGGSGNSGPGGGGAGASTAGAKGSITTEGTAGGDGQSGSEVGGEGGSGAGANGGHGGNTKTDGDTGTIVITNNAAHGV